MSKIFVSHSCTVMVADALARLHLLSHSLSLLFRHVSYMTFSEILWSVDW